MNEPPGFIAMEHSAFLEPLEVYLEAFAEHAPARRGELLVRCLTADAEIWGPKRLFAGYAAIWEALPPIPSPWPQHLAVPPSVEAPNAA